MKINITWEKRIMGSFEMDVTDEQLRELENGCSLEDIGFVDDPEYENDPNNWIYDYAVADEEGRTIINWWMD